ncbi:bifunctional adenosylcobinamide kinase/adenosylcobinamide-phosphate guanylyltransferase [Methylotenera sp.]|uniref:bifunctional adenosylcobinamide kinase/adenosylcobinamide-phosphate guanylyltransferase n=1 Tax=Methylotenera sp. TaxID=2051956 RepID=UPI0024870B49|nr:bifunctional adenosylcobinamide kinase/adenosylcobinamide-phosphate guanylyltransferase [Methylotenera sp.]MDI1298651.1 bifunctional adenosylcobinamide kinase/adenosylcobinamide-phosphate guanylyltransferase [Methylotenera sp.]
MSVHLILGGARSGKSLYAEQLAQNSGLKVSYVATAQIYDDEFKTRVQHHKDRRPAEWTLVEEPHYLAQTLRNLDAPNQCIIVDCLTLWLAQWICADCNPPKDSSWLAERAALLSTLPTLQGTVILVSNEVGMGIVPLGEINRQFQDEQGRLNQAVAGFANAVTFVAAGLPLTLKG